MDILDRIVIALVAAAGATSLAALAYLPRVWREYRWARRYGDAFEREIGKGMWWGHLGRLVATAAFVLVGVRLAMAGSKNVPYPELATASVAVALVSCIFWLISQVHYARQHLPDPERHLYIVKDGETREPRSKDRRSS